MAGLDIKWAILCDDVRIENNGKLIFIGIYQSVITVSEFPTQIMSRIVFGIDIKQPGEHIVELKIEFGQKEIAGGTIGLEADGTGPNMLPSPAIPLRLQEAGLMRIMAKLKGQRRWLTLLNIDVKRTNPATSVPQPS
jgi:hypothetical protein